MKKTTLKLWTEKGWLTLQPVTTANNVLLEDGSTVSQVLETLKNTTLKKNDEIVSTAAPYLISKFADDARRATLVLGEPYNDLDGTLSYGASLQSEKVSIQAYTIDDNGVKTTTAGVSATKEGKVTIKGELCDEYGNPLIDETAGTVVTVKGEHQATWDADTKLDKITTSGEQILYCAVGDRTRIKYIASAEGLITNTSIPQYWIATSPDISEDAVLKGMLISGEPTKKIHVATKNYVDTNTANKTTTADSDVYTIFGQKANGDLCKWYVGGSSGAQFSHRSFACYWSTIPMQADIIAMNLFTGDPTHPKHAANKHYVDTATTLYKTTLSTVSDAPEPIHIYCNTHENFNAIAGGFTVRDLVDMYEGNLNFLLFEHVVDTSGIARFIFDVYIDNEQEWVALTCSAGAQPVAYRLTFETVISVNGSVPVKKL